MRKALKKCSGEGPFFICTGRGVGRAGVDLRVIAGGSKERGCVALPVLLSLLSWNFALSRDAVEKGDHPVLPSRE